MKKLLSILFLLPTMAMAGGFGMFCQGLDPAVWTVGKAGFIDIAVSSRAPASTAMDNTVWTNAKAAYLDAAISTSGGSKIKDIQRGSITIGAGSATANGTITAVDMTKTELRFLGVKNSAVVASGAEAVAIHLANTTTITADRINNGTVVATVYWELTEFY